MNHSATTARDIEIGKFSANSILRSQQQVARYMSHMQISYAALALATFLLVYAFPNVPVLLVGFGAAVAAWAHWGFIFGSKIEKLEARVNTAYSALGDEVLRAALEVNEDGNPISSSNVLGLLHEMLDGVRKPTAAGRSKVAEGPLLDDEIEYSDRVYVFWLVGDTITIKSQESHRI